MTIRVSKRSVNGQPGLLHASHPCLLGLFFLRTLFRERLTLALIARLRPAPAIAIAPGFLRRDRHSPTEYQA